MFLFPNGKTPRSRAGTIMSNMESEINRIEESYYDDYEEESFAESQFKRIEEQSFVDEF